VALSDLARSLPGLVLVGFLPGYLVATACAPRWRRWLRAALAPGLSGGAAGVAGLLFHDLHIRFTAVRTLPLLAALLALAVVRSRTVRRDAPADLSRRDAALIVGVALAAGLATVGVMVAGFSGQPVPFETDAPVHGQVAAAIARSGDVIPVLPNPVDHSTWDRTRNGFEAVAALVSETGGPPAALAMLPVASLSLLLLPLGLAALAWETTRSRRIALLAPVLGLILPFPIFPVIFGEFPLAMDSTLVAGLVLAGMYAARGWATLEAALLTAAAVAAIWVVHGTEVLTALVIGTPLVAGVLLGRPRAELVAAGRRLAGVGVGGLAGAAAVTVLTRHPALLAPSADQLGGPSVSGTARFTGSIAQRRWIDLEYLFRSFVFPSQAIILLWLAGVAAAVLSRRLRWALVAQLAILACLADVVVTGRLTRLWEAVFPWATDDRLMSIQYWVLPLLMALGAVWVVERLAAVLPSRPRPALSGAALLAVAILCAVPGIGRGGDLFSAEKAAHTAASAADIAVLHRLAAVLPPGSTVLTEGLDDAGQWVGALTPDVPFFSTDYARSHADDLRLVALANACQDPAAAAAVLRGVDAVFVGAVQVDGARHPWSARCLQAVPGLRAVAGSGQAAAFVVDPR
jgi:hypothetical protein